MCPGGYEGTFVCEPDKHKALEMYREYRATGKMPRADAASAAAAAPAPAAH